MLAFFSLNAVNRRDLIRFVLQNIRLLIIVQMFTPTSSMRVAKLYKDNTEQITNIHYR